MDYTKIKETNITMSLPPLPYLGHILLGHVHTRCFLCLIHCLFLLLQVLDLRACLPFLRSICVRSIKWRIGVEWRKDLWGVGIMLIMLIIQVCF